MSKSNNPETDFANNSLIEESYNLLEWSLLKKHLSTFSSTNMGKKSILNLQIPLTLKESIHLLDQTKEIDQLESEKQGDINLNGVFDIKNNIDICSKGGVVTAKDLLEIAETISSFKKLKKILYEPTARPIFSSIVEKLVDHNQLEKILKNGIENNGRISDRASDKISQLRLKLNRLKSERRNLLDHFIKNNSSFIQDSIIGDRLGRPVLAIKVNYISKVKGIIHDSSASGNTIFLEPDSVVKKGNQIASMRASITNEEFKLLKKWSGMISDNSENLKLTAIILLKIENALTRSRYSNWLNGKPPKFENNASVSITGFTHPILTWEYKQNNARKPVPIDFYINRNIKVVAITGPNTGGKTAALKGLGISLLMARSGLYVPSKTIPVIPYYSNIYVDIGDNQSLENDLSTFSGHILRIKNILNSLVNKKGLSLVLLDEIRSGTDPEEGTALAIALLNSFAKKSDLTLATTHYGEIKALKYKDPRFENVSVGFDDESLKPTYKFNWGIPGRSNALSISKKIGLDQQILHEASNYLKPKGIENINKVIKGLEEQRSRQQHAAEEAAALIARTELLHEELKKNYEFQKLYAQEYQNKEREKLTKTIKKAKSEVVKLIERLRNKDASGEDSRKIGIRLKEIENQFQNEDKNELNISWTPKIGDIVKIKSLNSVGKVISNDSKELSYKINIGSFNSIISLSDLEGMNGEIPNLQTSKIIIKGNQNNYSFSEIRTSKNTIDVRGLRVHEAEIVVEEKMRNFHGPLWVIHGIGTGKLKKGLKLWLSQLIYVDKIIEAPPSEGGAGCSIVWVK